jgi:carbon storage regulator
MLILTRKTEQGILIARNILVRVLAIEHNRVKRGISAPPDVIVLRQELWHAGEEIQPFQNKKGNDSGGSAAVSA